MMNCRQCFSALVGAVLLSGSGNILAYDYHHRIYEITITNTTQGEIFTPLLVASHPAGVRLFELGAAASTELEMLAESGDTAPLAAWLKKAGARDVATADDVLPPGHSVTLKLAMDARNRHISLASMLVPSNDAFVAINGVAGPKRRGTLSLLSPAYDAGSEHNDELCVNIPGPPFICAGEGYNPDSGEGYVHIHPGVQGVGDLIPAAHDWRNPVASIVIRASRNTGSD